MTTQQPPVVVLTGVSRGIGLAIATVLLENFDAIVAGISRGHTPELTSLREKYPTALLPFQADVTDEHNMRIAIAKILETCHRIDALILNAGYAGIGRIDSSRTDEWRSIFEINFFSTVYTLQAALPALRKSERGGRVVFVSSGAASNAQAGQGAYGASKAALNSLCRVLASEEPSIVAVSVRPGQVDTAMHDSLRSEEARKHLGDNQDLFLKAQKEGKLVKPEDVGHVLAALALNAPKSMSGQFVSWDGEECKPFRRE